MGSRRPRIGPHLRVPRASHISAQHSPSAAHSLPPSGNITRLSHQLNGPTMPSIRRSLDQFGHGPSACSTRISSAHRTQPAQASQSLSANISDGSTSPLTSPSRPPNTTAETRLSLVALHAGVPSSHLCGRRPDPDIPARPGPVHPTRRTGAGGPCPGMLLPYCSPLGISWGLTPQSSSQNTPITR